MLPEKTSQITIRRGMREDGPAADEILNSLGGKHRAVFYRRALARKAMRQDHDIRFAEPPHHFISRNGFVTSYIPQHSELLKVGS